MNKVVGVYETEELAAGAIEALKDAGFKDEDLTVYNREDIVNNHIRVKMNHRLEGAEIGAVVAIGAIAGLLTGLGFFQIPGFHFLYDRGVIKGLLGGAVFGFMFGLALSLLSAVIIYFRVVNTNEKHLNEGKFLVFYDGHTRADIKRAHEVLHTPDLPIELSAS